MNSRDKRFVKSETAIFESYRKSIKKGSIYLSPTKLAKMAKISRSTFRRHYKNPDDIYYKRKHNIVRKINRNLKRIAKDQKVSDRAIIKYLLIEFYSNKDFFEIDISQCNCQATLAIFSCIPLKNLAKKNKFEKALFPHEAVAIIKKWKDKGFSVDFLGAVHEAVVLLSQATYKNRLDSSLFF